MIRNGIGHNNTYENKTWRQEVDSIGGGLRTISWEFTSQTNVKNNIGKCKIWSQKACSKLNISIHNFMNDNES